MFNKFKNALYGPATDYDPSMGSGYTDYKDTVIGKRIRGALTRSSSFRDEILSEVARNRSNDAVNDQNNDQIDRNSSLLRVRSQMLRKPTIPEKDIASSNMTTPIRDQHRHIDYRHSSQQKTTKFRYTRPEFLQLKTDDEIGVSADHQIRPIILPRDVSRLPWLSGYAECINAGKSAKNEDQAVCFQDIVVGSNFGSESIKGQLPFTIFGLYDGHAGNAVAVAAAAQLHHIISEKLRHIADILIALEFGFDVSTNDDEEFEDCISSPRNHSNKTTFQKNDKPTETRETTTHNADKVESEVDGHPKQGQEQERKQVPEPDDDLAGSPNKAESSTATSNSNKAIKSSHGDEPTKQVSKMDLSDNNNVDNVDKSEIRQDGSNPSEPNERSRENGHAMRTNDGEDYITSSSGLDSAFLASMIDINKNNVTVESLVKGALESSFWEMDEIIGRDKELYKMPGGCAAIVSLFILGKLYVCNAGDSRAIVCKGNQAIPMSFDFTPTSERERILRLGHQRPDLLGNDFTHLEFIRRPTRKDLGKRMLYRDAYMTGWSMKEISYDDLKFPLVWGEGKRSRLCACIGLSRGFGDHELRTQYGSVAIKPFLTPEPEVRVLDLEQANDLSNEDVLIQASDGLWDVATNQEIFELAKRSLSIDNEVARSKYRYISVAQDLVGWSRGWTTENCSWRMSDGRFASMDDISVFVVPLKQYRDEYLEWKRLRNEAPMQTNNRRPPEEDSGE